MRVPTEIERYHRGKRPLTCSLDVAPWRCEFWPLDKLAELNGAYSVEEFAPGYFGFASSGGGELFAWSPRASIVCLACVGMSPTEELQVARSWAEFEHLLRPAL